LIVTSLAWSATTANVGAEIVGATAWRLTSQDSISPFENVIATVASLSSVSTTTSISKRVGVTDEGMGVSEPKETEETVASSVPVTISVVGEKV
jgi:hypothetical protein